MKTPVSKYFYIEMLVKKIKHNYDNKLQYDWFFDELIKLYGPLINSASKKLYKKFKTKIKFNDVRSKVTALFFEAIRRYNPQYKEGADVDKFKYVYFSSYLNKFLPWEIMRISKPVKIDYDDLVIDTRNVEFESSLKNSEVVKKLVSKDDFTPISENFISLCRFAQKELRNDLMADIMMLHYGYDYKNLEIAKILVVSEAKVASSISHLKKFWQSHKDLLTP